MNTLTNWLKLIYHKSVKKILGSASLFSWKLWKVTEISKFVLFQIKYYICEYSVSLSK